MILVCGASGELGGRIVRRLRASGAPVRALVRPRFDATALSEMGVELTQGDFRDSESLRRAVAGVTTVVSTVTVIAHLGGRDAHALRRDGRRGGSRRAASSGRRPAQGNRVR